MNKDKYILINDGVEVKFRVDLSWNATTKQWQGTPTKYYTTDGHIYSEGLCTYKFARKKTVLNSCNKRIKQYIKAEKQATKQSRLLEERRVLAKTRKTELHFVNGKLTDKA